MVEYTCTHTNTNTHIRTQTHIQTRVRAHTQTRTHAGKRLKVNVICSKAKHIPDILFKPRGTKILKILREQSVVTYFPKFKIGKRKIREIT